MSVTKNFILYKRSVEKYSKQIPGIYYYKSNDIVFWFLEYIINIVF